MAGRAPSFVRRLWRWFPAAISETSGSEWAPVFWIVLMLVALVLAELIDDDGGFIPSGGGVSFRNRSVYGGGGGGVGK